METNYKEILHSQIFDLLKTAVQSFHLNGDDAMTMKTLKLYIVGEMLEVFGLHWEYVLKLFKTHTPVHPKIAQDMLKYIKEEMACTLAQIFVKNEKLARLIKQLTQKGVNTDQLLAVDGLGGNITNGPHFEQKHYIGNLRFADKGENKFIFDEESEFKRLHVQTVREMYQMLGATANPSNYIYDILRKCFYQTCGLSLHEIKFENKLDGELESQIAFMYMDAMGKDNMELLVNHLRLKILKVEKRTLETEGKVRPDEK